jgi:hypothetical protein
VLKFGQWLLLSHQALMLQRLFTCAGVTKKQSALIRGIIKMGLATTIAVLGTAATLSSASKDRSQARQATAAGKEISEDNLILAREQAEASRKFIEKSIAQGRSDLLKLFPAAQESRRSGIQAGLDVFNQTIPQQVGAFEQGNLQAQRTVAGALPNRMAALTGGFVNPNMQVSQPMGMRGIQFPQQLPQATQMPNMEQQQIPDDIKKQIVTQMLNGMGMGNMGGQQVQSGERREVY